MLHRTLWIQVFFSFLALSLSNHVCKKVTFNVPQRLEAKVFVGRVNIKQCFKPPGIIRTNNSNFTVLEDGSLYTTRAISLPSNENTIFIFLKGIHEHEPKKILIHLLTHQGQNQRAKARKMRAVVSRTKRRWLPVPTLIMENSLGPFPMQIQQLTSDTAQYYDIRYSISGPGVDQPPQNVFYIEKETGNLFVTCPIDRETYPEFQLICYATTTDGYTPEVPLVHIIKIEDDNDNPPVFDQDIYTFGVFENSRVGTLVGQVIAMDNDEANTLHTKLKYRIVYQSPQTYQNFKPFAIHPDTGSITVASAHLDREEISEYKLQIEARDMGGQEFGLCNTAEVIIAIKDVNDNAPKLAETVYEVQILENTENVEIFCIPVSDDDEPGTPSWLAEFIITKGNEDNAFDIIIDRDKNVGCLVALKGLDYEDTKERILEITVNNEVPYVLAPNSKALSMSTTKIVIHIRDENEGPFFDPPVYILNIKECLPDGTLVGNYQAIDPETGTTSGIRYKVIDDPCHWIKIDQSGDLRTAAVLDRENIENNPCKVFIEATDQSGKTGIGEILITVIDENDNYPMASITDYIMCNDKKPICIEAFDADLFPHTAPFHFEIEVGLEWKLTPNDDCSVLLSPPEDIEYGYYPVHLRIYDNEGNNGISEITVHFCNCVTPSDCGEHTNRSVDQAALEAPVDRDQYQMTSTYVFGPLSMAGIVLGSLMTVGGLAAPFGYRYWNNRGNQNPDFSPGDNVGSGGDSDDAAFRSLIRTNTEAPGEELATLNILPVNAVHATMGLNSIASRTDIHKSLQEINVKGQNITELSKGEGTVSKTRMYKSMEEIKGNGQCSPQLAKGVDIACKTRMHKSLEEIKGKEQYLSQIMKGRSLQNIAQPLRNSCKGICSEWQTFTNPHLAEKVFLCEQDDEKKHVEEYVHSYHYEGKGSPVGSLSACAAESDEEEFDFLNNLDPPFKTLVEVFVTK